MGTRRSKHNKGRKPLYKDFERETIRRWSYDEEKPAREKIVPEKRNLSNARRPTPKPELADIVSQYLAKRQQDAARMEADKVFPERKREHEFRLIDGSVFNPHLAADNDELVRSSDRDVLLQLFIERKISTGQLYAGRRWQTDRERATIQPNMTIDWSQSTSKMPYQRRGDLTGVQSAAMARRRQFIESSGVACASFLDFCLDADRGRSELMGLLRVDGVELSKIFDDLLSKLCVCFGVRYQDRNRTHVWRQTA